MVLLVLLVLILIDSSTSLLFVITIASLIINAIHFPDILNNDYIPSTNSKAWKFSSSFVDLRDFESGEK